MWAVLRFGLLTWLGDEESKTRLVVEGLSWVAGIGGLLVGAAALMVAVRQGRADAVGAPVVAEPGPLQTGSDRGVVINGGVSGGSGSGSTVGVNFGQVGAPPDPSPPARG